MRKKREVLTEIPIPREVHQEFRRVADDRVKDFVDHYLTGQRFPGGLSLNPMTLTDLASAVYLQGLWDGVELMEKRPELLREMRTEQ